MKALALLAAVLVGVGIGLELRRPGPSPAPKPWRPLMPAAAVVPYEHPLDLLRLTAPVNCR